MTWLLKEMNLITLEVIIELIKSMEWALFIESKTSSSQVWHQ